MLFRALDLPNALVRLTCGFRRRSMTGHANGKKPVRIARIMRIDRSATSRRSIRTVGMQSTNDKRSGSRCGLEVVEDAASRTEERVHQGDQTRTDRISGLARHARLLNRNKFGVERDYLDSRDGRKNSARRKEADRASHGGNGVSEARRVTRQTPSSRQAAARRYHCLGEVACCERVDLTGPRRSRANVFGCTP